MVSVLPERRPAHRGAMCRNSPRDGLGSAPRGAQSIERAMHRQCYNNGSENGNPRETKVLAPGGDMATWLQRIDRLNGCKQRDPKNTPPA